MTGVAASILRRLDNARPLSDAVAEILVAHHAGTPCDLARTMVLVPGARIVPAIERNLLARARAAGVPLVAPTIVTPLMFAGRLLEPARPVLPAPAARLSWREVLEASLAAGDGFAARVAKVFGFDADADARARMRIAARMQRLSAELATSMHSIDALAASPRAAARPDLAERLAVLAEFAARRAALLARIGCDDRDDAMRDAVRAGRVLVEGLDRIVVLFADPEPLQRALLGALRAAGVTIEICVHTDEAIDDEGFPVAKVWESRGFGPERLQAESIRLADGPGEAASEALAAVRALSGPPTSDEVALVAPSSEIRRELERALELAGCPAAVGESRGFAASRLGTLLARIGELEGEGSAEALAGFVRHDDAATWLRREHGFTDAETMVARYRASSLVGAWRDRVPEQAEGGRDFARVRDAVAALVEPLRGARPAHAWGRPIREAIRAIVGCDLRGGFAGERIGAIRLLDRALADLASTPEAFATAISCDEAIRLVLGEIAGREIRGDAHADGVSLLGWLDAGLADERHLVLVGFADGEIPQAAPSDPIVTDELRRDFGMPSSLRHTARDAWILDGILARAEARRASGGQASVAFVVPRRTAEGDPLRPSRFLLRVGARELPARVQHLFAERREATAPATEAAAASGRAEFPITPPVPGARIESMRVTSFRTYIECPYRFQLEHDPRLALGRVDERIVELDSRGFGTLVHAALERWGREELVAPRPTTKETEIARGLCAHLDAVVRERFPASCASALRVQVEIARSRLRRFAALQAAQASEGWRLHAVELAFTRDARRGSMQSPRLPDAAGLFLTGRIDRVDEREGRFRALDYKTSSSAPSPTEVHLKKRRGSGTSAPEWVDLQLPLYRVLLRSLPKPIHVDADGLGYANLGPTAEKSGFSMLEASDEQLAQAEERACDIAARVLAGEFTPTTPSKVDADDPFAPIWGKGMRLAPAANEEGEP